MENNNNLPLISVVINNFNNFRYIEKGILSVINQTYPNLEIIIWDDCSTDKRVENIYKKYKSLDSRIKIYSNETNMHIFTSRIKSLDYVNGEYVAFLDGDDSYDFDFIRHMYHFLISNKADIAVCSFTYIIENEVFIDSRSQFNKLEYTKKDNIINYMFDNQAATYAQNLIWNKLYKTEIVKKAKIDIIDNGLENFRLYAGEDILMNLFIMKFANKLCIDEQYVGNLYRRTEPLELKPYEKKISYINNSHNLYQIIYDIFLKNNSDSESSNLFYNFKQTIINTFSQYLYLYKLDINVIDMDRIKNYLNITNDKDLVHIKNQIINNSNQWLIPFTLKYKSKINKIKLRILESKEIIFNLENGLFNIVYPNKVLKNKFIFFKNKVILDFLLLALFKNKKIKIYSNEESIFIDELKNELKKYSLYFSNIIFVNELNNNEININNFNFIIDENKIVNDYNLKKIWNNSKFKDLISKNNISKQKNEIIKKVFLISYLSLNSPINTIEKSIFRYSYEFFYLLFISLKIHFIKKEEINKSLSKNTKDLMLEIYLKKIHYKYDTFFNFLCNYIDQRSYVFIQKIKNIFLDTELESIKDILYNTFFDNLSFWYESKNVIPEYLYLTEYDKNIYIQKKWQNETNNKPIKKFSNYKISVYKLPFIREITYLVTNINIFNNEMYIFMRKHKFILKLFWILNKKKIKK